MPADLPPQDAVLLPFMETAVSFVMDGQPLIGEQVVVFGQGVIGLLATRLLAEYPLASLVTVDPPTVFLIGFLVYAASGPFMKLVKRGQEQG